MDFKSLAPLKEMLLRQALALTSALNSWNPIPAKYRAAAAPRRVTRLRTSFPRSDDLTRLKTSFSPAEGVRELKARRWSVLDLQYVALAAVFLFSLALSPAAPLLKTLAVMGAALLALMPVTRQVFWPGMTIWGYLVYFFSSRFIPSELRPHIWVRVLPALENVLYGANLSNILSAHTFSALDLFAWLPYGILHFALPAVCTAALFLFSAPGTAPVFAWAFGWMNISGVTIQLLFPCTPPWYENERGLAPAAYGMPGSPAGLARIDKIFGFDMYTTAFSTAPVPFGAFPSMHSGNAVLEALVIAYCFPKLRSLCIGYVIWIWWATMYLSHHYAVDLVGGGLLAAVAFYVAKARFMPRPQGDKANRWEYEYVEIGDRNPVLDEELAAYSLGFVAAAEDSDEWTVGSSSSSWSGSGSGSISPAISEEGIAVRRGAFGEVDPRFWEGREEQPNTVVVVG